MAARIAANLPGHDPALPENDAPSRRHRQHQMVPYRVPRFSERFPYWCRTARIGPVSICVNLPDKKQKRVAVSGDPLWSCATLCQAA